MRRAAQAPLICKAQVSPFLTSRSFTTTSPANSRKPSLAIFSLALEARFPIRSCSMLCRSSEGSDRPVKGLQVRQLTGDKILIVDPASRKIVDIITKQEAER